MSIFDNLAHLTTYDDTFQPGHIGERATGSDLDRMVDLVNSNPQARQQERFTYGVFNPTDVLVINMGTQSFSYTVVPGDTNVTGAVQSFALALAIDPAFRGSFTANTDGLGPGEIDAIANWPMGSVAVSAGGPNFTVANIQAGGVANAISFGRAVIGLGFATRSPSIGSPVGIGRNDTRESAGQAAGALLGARDRRASFTYVADTVIHAEVKLEGVDAGVFPLIRASYLANTDLGTSVTGLAAALNQRLTEAGLNTLLAAANDTDELQVLSAIQGVGFTLTLWGEQAAGASIPVITDVAAGQPAPQVRTDIGAAFRGVSLYSKTLEQVNSPSGTASQAVYPANEGVECIRSGDVLVATPADGTPAKGGAVYVSLADGTFHTTNGAMSRPYLPHARWERDLGGGVSILRTAIPAAL